jgi:hypothetical protein
MNREPRSVHGNERQRNRTVDQQPCALCVTVAAVNQVLSCRDCLCLRDSHRRRGPRHWDNYHRNSGMVLVQVGI